MSTTSIRMDDEVREETTRIASELGLSFNAVINILARKFNAEKGFFFPVRLEKPEESVFELDSEEFLRACKKAVAQRDSLPAMPYVTRIDEETGKLTKVYEDGRVEYVL